MFLNLQALPDLDNIYRPLGSKHGAAFSSMCRNNVIFDNVCALQNGL